MVRRSLRQHALSTSITLLSVALATGLVMSVFGIQKQSYDAFTGGAIGYDAVLGAKVAVETPYGRLAVSIPAWSSSDRKLRLKGKGLPLKGGGHGDLYAHVRIMLPEGGDADLEALMRATKAGTA